MSDDTKKIEEQCREFLEALGRPGFIVFGWLEDPIEQSVINQHLPKKIQQECKIVSSYKDMPVAPVVKGLSWAMHEFVQKSL